MRPRIAREQNHLLLATPDYGSIWKCTGGVIVLVPVHLVPAAIAPASCVSLLVGLAQLIGSLQVSGKLLAAGPGFAVGSEVIAVGVGVGGTRVVAAKAERAHVARILFITVNIFFCGSVEARACSAQEREDPASAGDSGLKSFLLLTADEVLPDARLRAVAERRQELAAEVFEAVLDAQLGAREKDAEEVKGVAADGLVAEMLRGQLGDVGRGGARGLKGSRAKIWGDAMERFPIGWWWLRRERGRQGARDSPRHWPPIAACSWSRLET